MTHNQRADGIVYLLDSRGRRYGMFYRAEYEPSYGNIYFANFTCGGIDVWKKFHTSRQAEAWLRREYRIFLFGPVLLAGSLFALVVVSVWLLWP